MSLYLNAVLTHIEGTLSHNQCCLYEFHVIIDRQIPYGCETDQMAEFHFVATLNFGAF